MAVGSSWRIPGAFSAGGISRGKVRARVCWGPAGSGGQTVGLRVGLLGVASGMRVDGAGVCCVQPNRSPDGLPEQRCHALLTLAFPRCGNGFVPGRDGQRCLSQSGGLGTCSSVIFMPCTSTSYTPSPVPCSYAPSPATRPNCTAICSPTW